MSTTNDKWIFQYILLKTTSSNILEQFFGNNLLEDFSSVIREDIFALFLDDDISILRKKNNANFFALFFALFFCADKNTR